MLIVVAGCAPSEEGASPGEGPAAGTAPPPLVLPGLAGLETGVQDQIRARHAAVLALGGGAGASAGALGDAYGELGLLLQAAGFYQAAEDAYLNAPARVPGAVRWTYYLAHLYQATGQRARAVEGFRRVLDLESDNLPALVWLGEMHLDQGQPAEAERVLAELVRRCHERAGVSGLLTYLHRQGVAFDIKSGRRTRLESGTRKKVQLTEELDLREAA